MAYTKNNTAEFEVELNGYVRRYFLQNRMTMAIAIAMFVTGPLMAMKTGYSIFIVTHLTSCLLFFAYGFIAKRFEFFQNNVSYYIDLIGKAIVIESAWVLYLYSTKDMISLIAGASPTLVMVCIWGMNSHPKVRQNLISSGITSILIILFTYWVDAQYFSVNAGGMVVGAGIGVGLNHLVFRLFRYQFYFNQQEKGLRNHAYKQLEKVLYPHQRIMIEDGFTLEETMPVGWGDACVIAFDVIESSKIRSPYARTLLQNVLKKCQALMMENYSQAEFEANAYRIKEMGDGFLCSVGFPFKTPGTLSREALAIKLSQQFITIFHEEAQKLASDERVHCAVGIASGVIEAFYPHTTPKEYDLYGRPLILATRYESIRKELFNHIPKTSIIILQEVVHARLPHNVASNFQGFDLNNFRIRDDNDAKRLYYQCFDDRGHLQSRPLAMLGNKAS
ncbi:MAG: adenylate/guanylate cyclase domain-containing protein [Bdellovibrionota bacterium]